MADGRVEGDERSDADLIAAARAGTDDGAAYAVLYRRHAAAAHAAARALADRRADVDDLVSEGFARVLDAISRGGGPEVAFRPYLLTCVRNVCYSRARSSDAKVEPAGDLPDAADLTLAAHADLDDDRALVVRAFTSLPERWQLVLWHTEIEGRPAAEVAPLLGLAPNAVAALSYRAREGLREAYLQAHLQRTPPASCGEARLRLGGYARESLSSRDRQMVEQHLERCDRCRAILVELRDVATSLRSVVAPAVLGGPLAAYLAKLNVGKVATLVGRHWTGRSRTGKATAAGAAVAVVAFAAISASALTSSGQRPSVALAPAATAAPTAAPTTVARARRSSPTTKVAPSSTPRAGSPATTKVTDAGAAGATTGSPPSTLAPGGAASASTRATVLGTQATPATTAKGTTTTGAGFAPNPRVPPVTTRATTPTSLPKVADLSVSLAPIGPAVPGHDVYLSAVVTNAGPDIADAVELAVMLPAPFSFVAASPESVPCTAGPGGIVCDLGRVAVAQSRTIVVQAAVPSAGKQRFYKGAAAGSTLSASVTSSATDRVAIGNTASLTVTPTDGPLATMYAGVDHGDVVIVGNSLMSCNAEPCRDTNNDATMVAVGADPGSKVTASSVATLSLPPDAVVSHAWLVWGAVEANAESLSRYGAGRIEVGGVTKDLAGDVTIDDTATREAVTVRADVTDLVATNVGGPYRFSAIGGFESVGTNLAGGWSLVVVTERPADPERVLVVTGGLVAYGGGSSVSVSLGGLGPATSPVVHVGAVGLDGDRYDPVKKDGADAMSLSVGAATPVDVAGPDRPIDDVMTSLADGSDSPNTLGFDAFTVEVDLSPRTSGGLFAPAAAVGGALTLNLSGDEQVWLGVLTLAAPT